MITGYLPSATGRNTSARSTTPSSISIGASQSIFIPSRISDFMADAPATVVLAGHANAHIETAATKDHVRQRRHRRSRPVRLCAAAGARPDHTDLYARCRGRRVRGCADQWQGYRRYGAGVAVACAGHCGRRGVEAWIVATLADAG